MESKIAIKSKIKDKRQELRHEREELARIGEKLRAAVGTERSEQIKRGKKKRQQIFQLQRELGELRAATRQAVDAPDGGASPHPVEGPRETGALPDFVVIGAAKGGTTFLYHLLTRHPLVEHAAVKEPHYFDLLFEEGTEWYRRCFPEPGWKDGRKTITGEASPSYLWHPLAPERMAEVIPDARLIALLRNPVDRAYSAHHHRLRRRHETRSFEETIETALRLEEALETRETRPSAPEGEASEPEDRAGHKDTRSSSILRRGIYVDYLQRWSRFFSDEQMLVLKSEDFFERSVETIKVVLGFLDLPEWEPEASELGDKRNTGKYEGIDPATRRRLEEYFEPHNQRLYDYLGRDFGW